MSLSIPITKYKAFGFTLESNLYIPELPLAEDNLESRSVRVQIKKEEVDFQQFREGRCFHYDSDSITFLIKNKALFKVSDGRDICIFPIEDNSDDSLPIFVLGTCLGIILMQRRLLPLHGSAISIDGKAYAIVGDSGAGKSTLASAFLKRGYKLLSDDVIPVSFSDEGVPRVTPAYPQQKLWQESMDHFGLESREFEPIIDRETKFKVPVVDQFEERQLPLAGIIELTKTDDEQIHIEPIQDLYRFSTLFKHTYRNFIIRRAGLMDWHFNTSSKILPHVDMFHMRRPVSKFTANELVDKVLQAIGKEESVV